jgi:diaminopropionate ammonia-lyase
VTVTCATDGNHGRSVAWGAQLFGCNCVIFVHETVSEARCAAIARYGADVIRGAWQLRRLGAPRLPIRRRSAAG